MFHPTVSRTASRRRCFNLADHAILESDVRSHRHGDRRGAMLVLVAIMMIGFMLIITFAIDFAQMQLSKSELRTATEAASQAAAVTYSATANQELAIQRGQEIAAKNLVHGIPLRLDRGDFSFGQSLHSKSGKNIFQADQQPTNSVQVVGRRTVGSPSGPVPLCLGNLRGIRFFEPSCVSIATFFHHDLVLALDLHESFPGDSFQPMMEAVDELIGAFRQTAVKERLGVTLARQAFTRDLPLTTEFERVAGTLREAQSERQLMEGQSGMVDVMLAGRRLLETSASRHPTNRTMVVITNNSQICPDLEEVASDIASAGITIHTIAIGEALDLAAIENVASLAGGRHYGIEDADQLKQVCRNLALSLSTILTQ